MTPHDAPPIPYRAPRWVRGAVVAAFCIFCVVAAAPFLDDSIPRYGVWVGAAGVLLGLGGIIEVFVGRVILERDALVIRQWYRTERVALTEIEAVSLQGGGVAVRLKTGKWKQLPEWLGANRSLGRRLRDRLKTSASA